MHISEEVAAIINAVFISAKNARFEYVTPEQVLYEICRNRLFAQAFENCGGNVIYSPEKGAGLRMGIGAGQR